MNSFWKLLKRTRKYSSFLWASILCQILMAIFTIISIPMIIPFFQVLFERIPESNQLEDSITVVQWFESKFLSLIQTNGKQYALMFVCFSLVGVFFLKNLFRYLAMFFMAPLRNGVVQDIRSELYQKYLDLPMSFHSNERRGDLISRITVDIQELDQSILKVIEVIFKAPILIIGSLAFMFYISPSLSLFTLLLLLFTALVIGTISRALKKQSLQAQATIATMGSHVEESLSGVREMKAFNAKDFLKGKFEMYNSRYNRLLTKLLRRRDLSSPLSEFLGVSVVAVLMWYGSNLVFQNAMMPETFFAFIFAFYNVIEPSKSFSSAYYSIQKGMAAMDRVEEIIQMDGDHILQKGNQKILSFENAIRAEALSFSYHQDGPKVLQGLDFEIKKGEKIAFVGVSGSGKTTLMDLLMRFFDAAEGSLSIDGVNYPDIDPKSLRALFGLVSQETLLFNDTVKENIVFSRPFDQRKVNKAADLAFATDFINQMEKGLESNIGDKGNKLSGGQKQRISIARAVYENPPILILDEATSSLDAQAEKKVQRALDSAMKDKTAIVISHRLSAIKNADRIYILEEGKITGQGSHQQLLEKSTFYKRLVDMQTF